MDMYQKRKMRQEKSEQKRKIMIVKKVFQRFPFRGINRLMGNFL